MSDRRSFDKPSHSAQTLHPRAKQLLHSAAQKMLGASLSGGIVSFFKSLGIVGICFLAARATSSVSQIVMARWLSKPDFGDVQLVVTVAQIFSLFCMLGIPNAVVRYGAAEKRPGVYIASGGGLVALASLLTIAAALAAIGPLSAALKISRPVLLWGIAFTGCYSLYVFAASSLEAASRFARRGAMEIVLAQTFLVCFVALLMLAGKTMAAGAAAYIVSYVIAAAVALATVVPLARGQGFSRRRLQTLLPYASLSFLCGLGFLLTHNIQKMILNVYFSKQEVAVYGVYSLGTVNQALAFGSMLGVVLIPRAAASDNRLRLWGLACRSWRFLVLPLFASIVLLQYAVLRLSRYEVDWPLLLVFTLTSCVLCIQISLGQIIGAQGIRGMRLGLQLSLGTGIANCVLSVLLIPHLRVLGAPAALAASYLLSTAWLILVSRSYLTSQEAIDND